MNLSRHGLGLVLVFGGLLWPAHLRAATTPTTLPSIGATFEQLGRSAMAGFDLTPAQARDLEAQIRKDPQDALSRAKLLGYLLSARLDSRQDTAARLDQVLWMIDQAPANEFSGTPYCQIDHVTDPDGYAKARQAWLKQVDQHPDSAGVLANAAKFVMLFSPDEAETLFGRAIKADPANPDLPEQLAALRMRGLSALKPQERHARATLAVSELEQALRLTRGRREQFYLLSDLASAAFAAGQMSKAKQYAQRLLNEAAVFPGDWNTGNAIYIGNTILGRIALANGNVVVAREYLLASAATPGSPQLDSFGPNTSLADELLAKGERQAVLKYFQLCGRWWKMGAKRLNEWTKTVQDGGTPDWGPHLDY